MMKYIIRKNNGSIFQYLTENKEDSKCLFGYKENAIRFNIASALLICEKLNENNKKNHLKFAIIPVKE